MGVSKQAAQKRFVPKGSAEPLDLEPSQGFSRFTPRARNAVAASQNEARAAGNNEIGPAHLVLGLLTEPEGLGAPAISAGVSVSPDAVRRAAHAVLPPAVDHVPDLIPYGGHARKALELTLRQALRLGHNYIGTEHISSRCWNSKPAPVCSPAWGSVKRQPKRRSPQPWPHSVANMNEATEGLPRSGRSWRASPTGILMCH
jgi:ATP-dependent Clp protease ATP-binding subunit ClpA